MLKTVDLSKKLDKKNYKDQMNALELRLGELQREAKNLHIPLMIVFEGWDASGKGTLINDLILALDPRGFTVHNTTGANDIEALKPPLWRFWVNTPAKGRIAILNRSWYRRVTIERLDEDLPEKKWKDFYHEINAFERQLTEGECIIIKFFLHISKNEQKKRFKKLDANDATSWRVTRQDWKHHQQYEVYQTAYDEMLENTDTEYAPWTLIEAEDHRYATVKIFTTIVHTLEEKIRLAKDKIQLPAKISLYAHEPNTLSTSLLDSIDLSQSLTEEEYNAKLERYQSKLRELEHEIYKQRIPLVILYEGWDAAGKGGNIKRLTQALDPRGYQVVPIAAPNDLEKAHHYLWRFWNTLPKSGHITIYDRTWYGRVLVERVEGFCAEADWKRAYKEINEMEEHLTNNGTVIVKFWLHIDKEEQLKRFEERQSNPYKQWKITEEDWRNREKWAVYKEAIDEMLLRTSTTYAPWTVVESNFKYYARIKALKTVIDAIEKKL